MTGRALKLHEKDNVVTLLTDALLGDVINVIDLLGKTLGALLSREEVPRGHKLAMMDLDVTCNVVKYGEKIGQSSAPIRRGEWVHVHNLESLRGRGDLNG